MATMSNPESFEDRSNPIECLRLAYDQMYRDDPRMTEDSPLESRLTLARRVGEALVQCEATSPVLLDLGSGPAAVESQLDMLARSSRGSVTSRFGQLSERLADSCLVTSDVANIPLRRFPRRPIANVHHIRAASQSLPIVSSSVDVAFSNLSVDMLRADPDTYIAAMTEIGRVLKPTGLLLANFHHAELYDDLQVQFAYQPPSPNVAAYYNQELLNPYYDHSDTLVDELGLVGLQAEVVLETETVGHEKWWAVRAVMTPQSSDLTVSA